MKLDKLILSNFRGFDQLEIEFDPQLTVIAGVNGSGKSSILQAIRHIASYSIKDISDSQEPAIKCKSSDVKQGKGAFSISVEFRGSIMGVDSQIVRALPNKAKLKIIREKFEKFKSEISSTKKGSSELLEIKNELLTLNQLVKEQEDHFTTQWLRLNPKKEPDFDDPIFVFYSTQRTYKNLTNTPRALKPLAPSNAYVNALQAERVSLYDAALWLKVAESGLLSDYSASHNYKKLLEETIHAILPEFSDIKFHDSSPPRFSVLKNEERFNLSILSDGEKSLLALAIDLTRRLSLANPEKENPVTEGCAVVLIDEIELHLHPKWQRQVLRRLTKTFKNCQFIVTTHSPQVIGQTSAEKLRLLYSDKGGKIISKTPSQSKGMDSSWILQNIMGCPARDYEIERKLSKIFDLIDDDQILDAKKAVESLELEIGIFPELQEAISLVDRLEMLAEDNEIDS